MTSFLDIWKMLAGIAFFLLAMNFMEDALKQLAGRRFKLFLKKHSSNRLKAISGGTIVTGFLQSSSIVNLLILSMVGTGVVTMENALAIILGTNLGTTLDSWLVATLGFNLNIENWALPIAGLTGIFMAFLKNESKWYFWSKFLFSLAFLFIALGFIKTGMGEWVKKTDLSAFTQYPVFVFLCIGIFITAIIQSSSVTIALALSALYSNAITLYMAMAIVLGAEIGTTFKLFLASANGLAVKKRVALGDFLFNAITVFILFFLLQPINHFFTHILYIKNNLIALVLFQTLVNVFTIILFLPFLKLFAAFLKNRFRDEDDESSYISKVPVANIDLALDALEQEIKNFIRFIVHYSLASFELEEQSKKITAKETVFANKTIAEKYIYIKQLYGEIHGFSLKLQNLATEKEETERLEHLNSAVRNCMYAAKNIRDAQTDILQMRNSSNDVKYFFYNSSKDKLKLFYEHISYLLSNPKNETYFEELTKAYTFVTEGYTQTLQMLYKESLTNKVTELDISTLINFNRELYTSFKSMVFGVKDYLLTTKEGEYFDALPGFIR